MYENISKHHSDISKYLNYTQRIFILVLRLVLLFHSFIIIYALVIFLPAELQSIHFDCVELDIDCQWCTGYEEMQLPRKLDKLHKLVKTSEHQMLGLSVIFLRIFESNTLIMDDWGRRVIIGGNSSKFQQYQWVYIEY